MGEIDGFERGRMTELGGAEPPLQLALLTGRPLDVDEQTEAPLKAERGGHVGALLLWRGAVRARRHHRVFGSAS